MVQDEQTPFLSYLWGIETIMIVSRFPFLVGFLSYLWGIETSLCPSEMRSLYRFLSYLWGIETIPPCATFDKCSYCFYLTYEGLKPSSNSIPSFLQISFLSYLWGIETNYTWADKVRIKDVSILPMRDWNISMFLSSMFELSMFLSYLWGIETPVVTEYLSRRGSFYLTYEGLKLKFFFFFLARAPCFYLTYEGLKHCISDDISVSGSSVSILPMRDWNIVKSFFLKIFPNRFYLTYEGLKHFSPLSGHAQDVLRFYLTYEGLKLAQKSESYQTTTSVCILPMRDWNCPSIMLLNHASIVCILPMRDWNS